MAEPHLNNQSFMDLKHTLAAGTKTPAEDKTATIPAAFPWSGSYRATVRNLSYLRQKNMSKIGGEFRCKICEQWFTRELDLEERFKEISTFIVERKEQLRQQIPVFWLSPILPNCRSCGYMNCGMPVISKKRSINWLFLFLAQMLGCCEIQHLNYFCKHNRINHGTNTKDRLLCFTYMGLCKQLDPEFDHP